MAKRTCRDFGVCMQLGYALPVPGASPRPANVYSLAAPCTGIVRQPSAVYVDAIQRPWGGGPSSTRREATAIHGLRGRTSCRVLVDLPRPAAPWVCEGARNSDAQQGSELQLGDASSSGRRCYSA